jgi:hypothetical protein
VRSPIDADVELIGRCDLFAGADRDACYRWLGTTLNVVTDGRFAASGCTRLVGRERDACLAGARAMAGPLVTFS